MVLFNLDLKNFNAKGLKVTKKKAINKYFKDLISEKNQILHSLSKNYKNQYTKKLILKLKKHKIINLIGMGGSILGSKAIYSFLNPKKKFYFIDEYQHILDNKKKNKKKCLNLIISKSGNTLETISNSNILSSKSTNVFITENRQSYLMEFSKKLKAEVVHHNNFIGGRYSVLSEVGMLPAELMGFNPDKFRRFNSLIKNKNFFNSIIQNVSMIINLIKKKKMNSIILNYDPNSKDLFYWYQQLIAESLGKNGKGLLPIISSMPKDNHSVMQYYLDGPKNHFFTFFYTNEKKSQKIKNEKILSNYGFLKNKDLNDISYAQFVATQEIFKNKNIPFRSFFINKKNEEVIGELFTFFILETILLGKIMRVNPYNQPSVELIKIETKKTLIKT